jgi:CDP-diacylglycerol--glycerol-3-phosphate 3-phosphatidyltransferase
VSGLIPEGYTLLESEFEREVRRKGRDWKDAVSSAEGGEKKEGDGSGVELTEWEKEGWTYHAKGKYTSCVSHTSNRSDVASLLAWRLGIWLSTSPSRAPLLTLLGSSNLSTRSIKLDIETSFFITTTSPELQSALKKEVAGLRKWSEGRRVGEETWQREDRKVSWRCWWIMRVLRVENLL